MKQIFLALGVILMGLPAWSNPAATAVLNELRASKGLGKVTYSAKLEKAAQGHLDDMIRNDFIGHTGSNGSNLAKRMKRARYRFCFGAENIAWGQRNLASVMQEWIQSPGHYKNMVHRKVKEFALVRGDKNIWVMVLAARRC